MNGYNAEKYLKEAIDSIYSQTFKDWEIIFIDNCSTDNTRDILNSYDNKIKYYKTDENIPIGSARNFGLKYCKGEYLAFLDTDDIWLNDKLEKQIKILDENQNFQFCYGGVIYINEYSMEIGKMLPQSKSGNVFAQQLMRYEINQQAIVLRNNIEIEVNEALRHAPDFNMFMNIASKYRGYVVNDYLVKYRKHSNSLTSKNIDIWWLEMKIVLDNIFKDESLRKKYSKEYKFAYAKVSYNKARYLMSVGNQNDANNELSRYKFIDLKYFMLYVLSLFPIKIWDLVHRLK
jgi:glycosyltransferase involved in cell wall biosynthesis